MNDVKNDLSYNELILLCNRVLHNQDVLIKIKTEGKKMANCLYCGTSRSTGGGSCTSSPTKSHVVGGH
jgi:hypothetical protein